MDEREKILGFLPQKEKIYNKYLPYADNLDVESNAVFAEIKANLGKSVALRDIKTGANHWSGQLTRYIKLNGMKFCKEDHLALINLMYELVVMPELELSLVQKFAAMLINLLKKRDLLNRDDLVLHWRPLYKLVEYVAYSPYEHHGLQLFPSNIENVIKSLVKQCRVYFPIEATQEMLDEWRPLMCPFDVTHIKAMHCFEYFLPTNLPPSEHDQGFKLWFEEFIDLWDSCHNTPPWEASLVNLFARLAHDNIGYIDWTPHISKIFNRFLRSFNLPVGTQEVQIGRTNNTYDVHSTVTWVVSLMGRNQDVQEHINKLFKTLQTFYHPSNLGKWNIKLSGLLMWFPKLLVKRLHRERYKKSSWHTPIPENEKLTEDDITKFVESMRPVICVSMFSKYGSQDSAIALRHLSNLRPEIVVPDLLERMYPAMENLTEPHRLIACMICIVAVARPMLQSPKFYPEGKSHVLPLLNLALPGIDPNDFKKCLVTFQMISTFVTLVPIVDCSDALHLRNDLTENERELCSATAQFEDFVLQFMDRVLGLIENSAQEHIHGDVSKLNPEQRMLEVGLSSTFTSVLQQCSSAIFKSALRHLHHFVANSIYETKVGGRFAANLCRAAAKVNPEATLKLFLPHLFRNIKEHIASHEDFAEEERLDNSFLWNLLMLSQLVRCNGAELVKYKDNLLEIIELTIHLKCVEGYELTGQLIRYTLRALTLHYPLDYKSIAESFDRPVTEYLPINDWAVPGDSSKIGMVWHIPSTEEVNFASQILHRILGKELEAVQSISADKPMKREELLCRLNVVLECLQGAGAVISMWEDKKVDLIESQVPLLRFTCSCSLGDLEIKLNGRNIREAVVTAMRTLISHMTLTCEDDTKGMLKILSIYEAVLFFHGAQKNDFDSRWKSFHAVKMALQDDLRKGKRHIRALLVDRVQLQQEMRLLYSCERIFTERHRDMMNDLYNLSVSRYREVRKKSQAVLFSSFNNIPYSYRCVLPDVITHIKNSETPEYQFKGALYVILGSGKRNMATKRSWEIISGLWPAITQAQHSEKPSILKVVDDMINKVDKNMESPGIVTKTTESVLSAAQKLLQQRQPFQSDIKELNSEQLKSAQQFEQNLNDRNLRLYNQLVEDLVKLVNAGNLTWKFSHIGLVFLSLLLRHDTPVPASLVALNIKTMVHDSLHARKLTTAAVSALLKQQKRKHKKVVIDPHKISGTERPTTKFCPGDRKDNKWILYNSDDLPTTKEKYDKLIFIEKTHWGYYSWPKEMEVYAPYEDQPNIRRSRDELPDNEKPIYDAFMDPEFVKKFVSFLALEENKGKDKFRHKYLTLFKGLFRNYGDTFLESFKPHIEKLTADSSHDKHDSHQRCGMEMLCGILRGAKHWPYDMSEAMWEWALPVIRKAMSVITVSTISDWGNFFSSVSESRDPRKMYKFFELLLENPLNGEGGSFGDTSRLYALQQALIQQEWRVPDLLHRVLTYVQPHLSHPYKIVRDRIGSMISDLFLFDYKVRSFCDTSSPKKKPFLDMVIPQLDSLKFTVIDELDSNQTDDKVNHVDDTNGEEPMNVDTEETDERKIAIRLCKTIMKWLTNSLGRTLTTAPPEIFPILPIMCTLQSESKDEEMKSSCTLSLACFSQALIQPEVIPVAISTMREIIGLKSWHARVALLGYLQVMTFNNFFTVHQPSIIEDIQDIVFHLICDEQLEVREMAAVTLSGLLHCGYLQMNKQMVDHFERLTRIKLKKRRVTENITLDALIKRHAGVLGLSAFVQAYPYDVPEFMPQILMDLSNHVDDPQPIQMTVKKTLSNFRRTHHDNWHDHKQMFTDDQLVILTDLLVSPTYYA
ncbi:proteasome activator subunit 4 [Mytilus galloprovincialis]|uniref:Proteasome activator subunit 4 n=1 Tax=Mytilus galloprovincialis TaxID=29158 RepID=A0A8B6DN62_MYTGA|nr:proteasome activator subunit 4 [Mytilus galloprovincialis]VDI21301.1 proteasome activator subunit 4 [Mytilus galloprovincialis]